MHNVLMLLALSALLRSEVVVEAVPTQTLRPHQDLVYVVISLENRSDKPSAISRVQLRSSLDVAAKPQLVDQMGRIQLRPREQSQIVLELVRAADMPYYINSYDLEWIDGDGKTGATRFSIQVNQEWPWRGHKTSLWWDQSVGENGPKGYVLELEPGYTATVNPGPTTSVDVTGIADGQHFTLTFMPKVPLSDLFNEPAGILVHAPDGTVQLVTTYCFRVEKIHH